MEYAAGAPASGLPDALAGSLSEYAQTDMVCQQRSSRAVSTGCMRSSWLVIKILVPCRSPLEAHGVASGESFIAVRGRFRGMLIEQ